MEGIPSRLEGIPSRLEGIPSTYVPEIGYENGPQNSEVMFSTWI